MTNQSIDLLSIRDEIMDYLATHTRGRQEIIADLLGIRRESLYAYTTKRSGLVHVEDVQKLYDWMQQDQRNQQRITRAETQWLLENAQAKLKETENLAPRKAKRAAVKWTAKVRKYEKMMREWS